MYPRMHRSYIGYIRFKKENGNETDYCNYRGIGEHAADRLEDGLAAAHPGQPVMDDRDPHHKSCQVAYSAQNPRNASSGDSVRIFTSCRHTVDGRA